MWTTKSIGHWIAGFLLAAALGTSTDSNAQGAQENESDQQFLSRIQSRLDRAARRIDELEKLTKEQMGGTSATTDRLGVDAQGGWDQTSTDPSNSDLPRMRLELRSLGRKVERDRERMEERYRDRAEGEFDRDYWEGYVRRLERDLEEMRRKVYRR